MEVVYEFKNPDWTLVWSQPGEMIPYFDREKQKAQGIREGYGAVYHGDKDKLIVWVGDSQVFTETKAVEWKPGPGAKEVHKSPNFDHHEDWFQAIKTGTKTRFQHRSRRGHRVPVRAGQPLAYPGTQTELGPGETGDRRRRRGAALDEPSPALSVRALKLDARNVNGARKRTETFNRNSNHEYERNQTRSPRCRSRHRDCQCQPRRRSCLGH